MQGTALHSRRRARANGPLRRKHASLSLILAALTAVFALGLGLLLLAARPAGGGSATGTEHAIGSASAPVVVDEWSDFE